MIFFPLRGRLDIVVRLLKCPSHYRKGSLRKQKRFFNEALYVRLYRVNQCSTLALVQIYQTTGGEKCPHLKVLCVCVCVCEVRSWSRTWSRWCSRVSLCCIWSWRSDRVWGRAASASGTPSLLYWADWVSWETSALGNVSFVKST